MLPTSLAYKRNNSRPPVQSQADEMALLQRAQRNPGRHAQAATPPPADTFANPVFMLPVITASSHALPRVTQALAIVELHKAVEEHLEAVHHRVAFIDATRQHRNLPSSRTAYRRAIANLLGLLPHEVPAASIIGNPCEVHGRLLKALRAFATSRLWWMGRAPTRPRVEHLGLGPDLQPGLQSTLNIIERYTIACFNKHKQIAIGSLYCLTGVVVGVAGIYQALTQLHEGKIVCDGYAWDAIQKVYLRTMPEEWYNTPVGYFNHGRESNPIYPQDPSDVAVSNSKGPLLLGILLVWRGCYILQDVLIDGNFEIDRARTLMFRRIRMIA